MSSTWSSLACVGGGSMAWLVVAGPSLIRRRAACLCIRLSLSQARLRCWFGGFWFVRVDSAEPRQFAGRAIDVTSNAHV